MSEKIYDLIINLPEHSEKALNISFNIPESYKKFDKIVFAGMGGSGIGGNIVKDWVSDDCPVPVIVSKSDTLPACVDSDSLLFCVSYSGDTHETLSCLDEGMKRGCKIIGVSSGGELSSVLERNKIPLIKLPKGMPPRAALPYLFFPIANVLSFVGLKKKNDCSKAIKTMKRYRNDIEEAAKNIASEIANTFPFIYGNFESACMRFKALLNENSKIHAKYELFTELNHNELIGWQGFPRSKISVIILNNDNTDEHLRKSVAFLREILKEKATMIEIFSRGKSKLEKIFYFIYLGDLVSYYLAKNKNEDPSDIRNIEKFKKMATRSL